jgi:hypothetical protein
MTWLFCREKSQGNAKKPVVGFFCDLSGLLRLMIHGEYTRPRMWRSAPRASLAPQAGGGFNTRANSHRPEWHDLPERHRPPGRAPRSVGKPMRSQRPRMAPPCPRSASIQCLFIGNRWIFAHRQAGFMESVTASVHYEFIRRWLLHRTGVARSTPPPALDPALSALYANTHHVKSWMKFSMVLGGFQVLSWSIFEIPLL